jgi:DNA-binding beta-propeller fold protein YncE
VDVENHAVAATIPVGDGPGGIAVSSSFVYVSHRYTPLIYKIDKSSDQVVQTLDASPVMAFSAGVAVA